MTDREMNRMTRIAAPLGAAAVALGVMLGALAAMAQTPPATPVMPPLDNTESSRPLGQPSPSPAPPAAVPAPKLEPGARPDGAPQTADILGLPVVDRTGRSVGIVAKVDRLPSGTIKDVEIRAGGFLGIGSKMFKVAADKLDPSGHQVVLKLAPEQIDRLIR